MATGKEVQELLSRYIDDVNRDEYSRVLDEIKDTELVDELNELIEVLDIVYLATSEPEFSPLEEDDFIYVIKEAVIKTKKEDTHKEMFGAHIRYVRDRQGLSQDRVAKEAKMAVSYLASIESERVDPTTIPPTRFIALCEVLKQPIEAMLIAAIKSPLPPRTMGLTAARTSRLLDRDDKLKAMDRASSINTKQSRDERVASFVHDVRTAT